MSVNVLLHTCCAPCSSASIERLITEGYTPFLFFSNSNIWPEKEYWKRLEAARKLAEITGIPLRVDEYDHQRWLDWVSQYPGFDKVPEGSERCRLCFGFSLNRTAEAAEKMQIPLFTTSLSISPHKSSVLIFSSAGDKADTVVGEVEFLKIDFKKKEGFKKSLELSKKYGLYRQDYCGCEYSVRP